MVKKTLKKIITNATVQKFAGAIFTQSILSATNMIIGILVARSTQKEEYALYVIAFNIIIGAMSYQNAIINAPFTVLAPAKNDAEKNGFASGLYYGQWLIFLPLFFFILLGSAAYSLWQTDYSLIVKLIVLFSAILTCFAREYLRTIYYSHLDIYRIFIMDIAFTLLLLFIVCILYYIQQLSSIAVVLSMALAHSFSTVIGYKLYRCKFVANIESIKEAIKEAWHYGKWNILGTTVDTIQAQGYLYIVSLTVGLAETANMSAARILLMPIGLCITSSAKIIVAKGAIIFHYKGYRQLIIFILLVILSLISIWLFYIFLLGLTYSSIIDFIYKGRYTGLGWYLYGWGFYFLMQILSNSSMNCLVVLKKFKEIAKILTMSSISMTIACIYLTIHYGAYGALISLIFGLLCIFVLCTFEIKKSKSAAASATVAS